MSLPTENTKKTSTDFSHHFAFLTKEFGLRMYIESYSIIGGDMYVRVLRNDFVQVELAGDQSYFHAEIRRLVGGEPRPYFDEGNNIGFEDLAVLLTNNNYDHSDYYPASVGWETVLINTAKLFRSSKGVFTTDKWVDTGKIEELKDEEFRKKFGFKPIQNRNKPTFFQLIKRHALKLIDKGFGLTLDSSNLPPYDYNSHTSKLILEKDDLQIKISQRDWRDYYYIFYIEINGQERFEINLTSQPDIETAAKIFNDKLDKLVL